MSSYGRLPVVLLVAQLLLAACSSVTHLGTRGRAWVPYVAGETLVFQNSAGLTDTLRILEIQEGLATVGDGLTPFPDRVERISVWAEVTNSVATAYQRRLHYQIFSVSAAGAQDANVGFYPMLKNAQFNNYSTPTDELDKLPVRSLRVPFGSFSDVIAIEDEHAQYADAATGVKTLYWSRSQGYLRFDLHNGERWELLKK